MEKEKSGKRLVLKFAEGFGSYVGEPGWTVEYALRKASQDLGIDPKLWEPGERTETKKAVIVQVIRKAPGQPSEVAPAEHEVENIIAIGTPEASTGSPGETEELDETSPQSSASAEVIDLPEVPVRITLKRSEITETLKVCMETTGTVAFALSGVLIDVTPGVAEDTCTFSASNLETSYTKRLACVTSCPDGQSLRALVRVRTLLEEIKALPSDVRDVDLSVTSRPGNRAVSVNGRCSIHAMDPEEFPELPSGFDIVTKVRNMKEALGHVVMAVSKDDTRYVLTGLFLDFAGRAAVGCDGFRLHFDEIEAVDAPRPAILVPVNAMKIVLKYRGEDEVHFSAADGRHVAFQVAGGRLTARLMDGDYPNYKEILPRPNVRVTFAAAEFLKLIDGATPISSKVVRLTINGDLKLTAAQEVGSYEWRIPCTHEGSSTSLVYDFNPAFLRDAIKAFPSERIALGTPDGDYGSCIVNDKAVVMPVRI